MVTGCAKKKMSSGRPRCYMYTSPNKMRLEIRFGSACSVARIRDKKQRGRTARQVNLAVSLALSAPTAIQEQTKTTDPCATNAHHATAPPPRLHHKYREQHAPSVTWRCGDVANGEGATATTTPASSLFVPLPPNSPQTALPPLPPKVEAM